MEIWKKIEGYENYSVSTYGRVRNDKTGRILKPMDKNKGYLYVNLQDKCHRIHRLVAQTFIPNPNNYPIVNHKDEDKSNNNVKNLEWCTSQYNNTYGTVVERRVNSNKTRIPVVVDGVYYISLKSTEKIFGWSKSYISHKLKKDNGSTFHKGHSISYA